MLFRSMVLDEEQATAQDGNAYIETSGAAYLNTGVASQSGLKITSIISDWASGTFIYGGRNTSTSINTGLYWYSGDQGLFLGYGNHGRSGIGQISGVDTSLKNTYVADYNLFYVNGVLKNSYTKQTYANGKSIYLCAVNNNNVIDTRYFVGKIYRFTISKDGVDLIDLIPSRDASNTVCFYDNVTKPYKYKAGTGTLTYGED